MAKTSIEKKSKRTGFSVVIVPRYGGCARQFKLSRFVIFALITAFLLICSTVVVLASQNVRLRQNVAQYKGMRLDQIVRLQSVQLDAANETITKSNNEVAALKKYVSYLGKLDSQVRKTLGIGNIDVSLTSILKTTSAPSLTASRSLSTNAKELAASVQQTEQEAQDREKTLIVLQNAAEKYNSMVAETPSVWPLYGLITSPFGWRSNPFGGSGGEYHEGLDIAAPYGTPIRATADGKVEQSGWNGSYGISITIYHRDGIETLYGHMSRTAVAAGVHVTKGQVIGYVGATGRATGCHCHYQVMIHGTPVNPMSYLN